MNVGAVIVAAQDLAQDKTGNEELETFLPMLPVEGTTVIKREIYTLRKAGYHRSSWWRISGFGSEKSYQP